MKPLWALALLMSGLMWPMLASAKFSTEPAGCLEKFSPPCSILTQTKSEFQNPEFKLYTSQNALFQFQNSTTVYLARGVLWIQATGPLTIQSKFGKIQISQAGEYWIDMSANEMFVKAIKENLSVQPRGAQAIEVKQGFEMRVSYVNQQTHEAEYSVPIVINLSKHLASLQKAWPQSGMNLQEYATYLGRVVLDAAQVNADWYQDAVQRKVSSAEAQENRLKYESEYNIKRDSYLQKLYRTKNNFEDQ